MEESLINGISIIIPVYNAEKYLKRCLDSVLAQTYTNFELIIINDGSTDSSQVVIDEFASKDDRIIALVKENSGVSDARNLGIDNANRKYICFIDADDWIEKDYLEVFIENVQEDTTLIFQDMWRGDYRKSNFDTKKMTIKTQIDELVTDFNLLYNGGPVCKLYNHSIIENNHLRFSSKISYGEDLIFFLSYLSSIKDIQFVNYAGYHYCYNEDSASRKYHDFTTLFSLFISIKEFIQTQNFTTKKSKLRAYEINWDILERSIDDGVIKKKLPYKLAKPKFKVLKDSLNIDYFKNTTIQRKVIYVLIKTGLFRIIFFIKNKI